MEKPAHEYERMAREYLNPAPEATERVDIRLKEAQIYATLAVAAQLDKFQEKLDTIIRHTNSLASRT